MKYKLLIFLSLFFFALSASAKKNMKVTGKDFSIVISQDSIDVGDMTYGDAKRVAVFKFKNKGKKAIHVNSSRVECSCTDVEFERIAINPGQIFEFKVTLNLEGFIPGENIKKFALYFDRYDKPVYFTLRANLKKKNR